LVEPTGTLEDIVITATKRATTVQDTPIIVAAVFKNWDRAWINREASRAGTPGYKKIGGRNNT